MKKPITILSVLFSLSINAQPVIQNGNNVPLPGYTAPVSVASGTYVGNSGANQTWNYSSFVFNTIGTMTVIAPSSSPIGSSFPSANFAYTFGGTSSFFNVSATKMEVQAYSITNPGSGNDYSPNPRTALQFPFSFGNSVTDAWQKTGGSVNTVTLTYDGYGTLATPTATYSNVVRVKESYGNGDDYQWYSLNPLMSVMVFDHNTNNLYYTGVTVTGVEEQIKSEDFFSLYPNPSLSKMFVNNGFSITVNYSIINLLGNKVSSVDITPGINEISTANLISGSYFYQITNGSQILKTGKLIIN